MTKTTLILLATVGVTIPAAASAGYDCESSVEEYNSALDDISSYLRRYSTCVSSSKGTDDCSTEFRRLRYAQDAFESAVSDVSSYCEL